MPVPSDEATWKPIARKLLFKQDQQQLPLKKATRRLCRRGAKKFGIEQSDTELQAAVKIYIDAARASGSLVLTGRYLSLPEPQGDRAKREQTSKSSISKGTKPEKSKSQADVQTAASSSPRSTRKRKQAKVADSHAAPTGALKEHDTAAQAQTPARKKPRKAALAKEAQEASQPETAALADEGKAAQVSSPAKKKRAAKKRRDPLSRNDAGGSADVNNADSMPGIPGAGTAEKTWRELDKRTDVKRGRFSQTEKETLIEAIKDFARAHSLSDTDLSWIYNTKNNLGNDMTAEDRTQRKNAWTVIAQALPHRTPKSVWACATRVLHEGNYLGGWSEADTDRLLQLQAEQGNKWRAIGAALGRHPENCRYKHRELLLGEAQVKGKWSSDEEARLTELVTQYIEERPEPDVSNGRILIDAVNWDVISRQHGSRAPKACRQKWYDSLAPSMVSRGDWGIGDDRRLLKALFRSGCSTEWQVDWSAVVPQRTAVAAKRRWRLMLKSVPDAQEKEFPAIVDELVSRYVPALKQRAGQAAPGGLQGEREGGEPARMNALQGAEQEAAAGPQGNAAEPARANAQQLEAYEQEEPSEEATSLLDDSMRI